MTTESEQKRAELIKSSANLVSANKPRLAGHRKPAGPLWLACHPLFSSPLGSARDVDLCSIKRPSADRSCLHVLTAVQAGYWANLLLQFMDTSSGHISDMVPHKDKWDKQEKTIQMTISFKVVPAAEKQKYCFSFSLLFLRGKIWIWGYVCATRERRWGTRLKICINRWWEREEETRLLERRFMTLWEKKKRFPSSFGFRGLNNPPNTSSTGRGPNCARKWWSCLEKQKKKLFLHLRMLK